MKTAIILFCLLICSRVEADVSWEIVGKDLDGNGNMVIKTAYFIDGKNVSTTGDTINGKYYFTNKYNVFNFPNLSIPEIEAKIKGDLDVKAREILEGSYAKAQDQSIVSSLGLIGDKNTVVDSKIFIDVNDDNTIDEEWTVKSDGTKTVNNISPIE